MIMSSFEIAKKNYYEFKKVTDENFEGLVTAITDYVSELEQQNDELEEFNENLVSSNKEMFAIIQRFEQQNAELIKMLAQVKKIIDIYELYNDLSVELFYDDLEKLLKEYKGE